MPESLPDLVARLRATTPALADVPDDILTAEVARQVQARGGPAVGEALEPDYGYGFRYNSRAPKGLGYFGTLKRPVHAGEHPSVMGEYSIPLDEEHGDLREIPSMVPTLTREEVQHLLLTPEGTPLPPAIVEKAQAFARQRLAAGLPVFARAGEQQTDLYPELPRDTPEARPQAPPMMASHTVAPSVGDALGVPTFRTSNEKDAGGAAVVRAAAVSPWTKAATIGAPGLGDRYPLASVGEILASDHPLKLLAEYVTGPGRPRSVANADPTGITAFHEGKAPPPMFMGSTEEVGASLADELYSRFGSTAHPETTSFILKDGTRIRGGGNTTHADLANAIGQRVDDLQLDGIVRNVHQQGIEVATPITEAQARVAVDDAKVGDYPLNVDVMGPGGLQSKVFTRPSVTGVRNWIREALK